MGLVRPTRLLQFVTWAYIRGRGGGGCIWGGLFSEFYGVCLTKSPFWLDKTKMWSWITVCLSTLDIVKQSHDPSCPSVYTEMHYHVA